MPTYNAYIFTEALHTTGLGHLGRCSALAEILLEKNDSIVNLVIHSDKSCPNWEFSCPIYKFNWKNPSELEIFLKNKNSLETMFYVDSYLAELKIYNYLKEKSKELICIDDDNRLNYPYGSIILNPGFPGLFIDYDTAKYKVITGKEQVLLRKPFREEFAIPQRKTPLQKVLLTMGGADLNRYSEQFLKILVETFPNIEKHLVIGNGFTNEEKLQQIKDDKTLFYKNLSAFEMRDLMLSVDYAITAGGQTTYELDACGVSFAVIETAENQRGNIRGFVELQGVREIKKPVEIISLWRLL